MDAETSQINPIVPEILLAHEKDNRYRQSLSSLVSTLIAPYLNISPIPSSRRTVQAENDSSGELNDHLKPEISLLVRVIHAVVMAKEGKSLGLEYVGLGYTKKMSHRLRIFVALYILCPYILERVSRKGWNDLRQVKLSLFTRLMKGSQTHLEREHLRGKDRRTLHEESRQRMLERARIAEETHVNEEIIHIHKDSSSMIPGSQQKGGHRTNIPLTSFRQRVRLLLVRALEQMQVAREFRFPTPHGSSNTNSDGIELENLDNRRSADRLGGFFKWIIRLNLALFYVNGKYPSLLHRLSGLGIQNKDQKVNVKAEMVQYNTIGLMIIGQSLAKLVQALAEISLNYFYARKRRVLEAQNMLLNTNNIDDVVDSREEQSLNLVTTFNPVNCGICMNPRKHSAAPVACGHVFCWSCLHNWVATVRPECPLCRAPSRTQEIIALHSYSPH